MGKKLPGARQILYALIALVALNLDEGDDRVVDIGCDPFTLHLATLPSYAGALEVAPIQWSQRVQVEQFTLAYATRAWRPYTSPAPPFLS
ncbi:MAG: hypothetical protein ABJ226_19995 [Roseobacter sp.]